MLRLERLESRDNPAAVSLAAGSLLVAAGADPANLTVNVSPNGIYTINDSLAALTLDAAAVAAGWVGGGTKTVSGPASAVTGDISVTLGGGAAVVNVRGVRNPLSVVGSAGDVTVNVGSTAPLSSGSLNAVSADVSVAAGTGAVNALAVSNASAATTGSVAVNASGVTGLKAGFALHTVGMFTSLSVSGSNVSTLAETFVIDSPPAASFTLRTNGGNDSVFVTGDVTGDFYLGIGNDTLEVAEGVTLYGDVYTGAGTNVVRHDEPGYGFIVGTVN